MLDPTLTIKAILRALVRYALSKGVRYVQIAELLKQVMVTEAQTIIANASGSVSVSKISMSTGLHRSEVGRLSSGEDRSSNKNDVLNRVIGLWSQGKKFQGDDGEPRDLLFQGEASEFSKLVEAVSKETSHYPVLFELERIGAIEYDNDKVKLLWSKYVDSKNIEHGLDVLTDDIDDLIIAVESNLTEANKDPSLHLRTYYDNISSNVLPEIRRWILEKGAAFHKDVREFLSKHDRDITPNPEELGEKSKVVVTLFSNALKVVPIKQVKAKKRGRKKWKP